MRIAVETSYSVAADEFRRRFSAIRGELRKAAFYAANRLRNQISINLRQQGTQITDLDETWQPSRFEDDGVSPVEWGVESAHPMAALREYGSQELLGGPIRPGKNNAKAGPNAGQKTKALFIPTDRTGLGRARGTPLTYARKAGQKSSVFQKRKGRPFAFGVAKFIPLIVDGKKIGILAESVTVPPHPYVAPAIESTREAIVSSMRAAIQRAVTGHA